MTSRPMFLKWVVFNTLAAIFMAVISYEYAGRLTGAAIVAVPLILAVGAVATLYAGWICWASDDPKSWRESYQEDLLLKARWVYFGVWVCQILGIMATVFGFWLILTESSDTAALGARIQDGGGVALAGTFVGVFCSLLLAIEHRAIESRLA